MKLTFLWSLLTSINKECKKYTEFVIVLHKLIRKFTKKRQCTIITKELLRKEKKSVWQFDLLYTKPSYKIQKFQYCGPGKEMNTYLFDGIERPEKDTHI